MELGQRLPVMSEMLGQDGSREQDTRTPSVSFLLWTRTQLGANLPKQGILALKIDGHPRFFI